MSGKYGRKHLLVLMRSRHTNRDEHCGLYVARIIGTKREANVFDSVAYVLHDAFASGL